ncbi:uncharacterized protein PV09_08377 [Verruconis gallopava]|uniref:Acyclic terpene utilisation N-terminal domain-containing protein n=1 Tax=Verruconis gallopava TaxID=253628 RepID=A0A0D2A170_9PEZI|nr:uncharacterized protein PV09_08377 [Verruconis gallopava]KIW00025.1 hypothetical protein PV09_08377 [Verruconis gallopava]
MSPALKRAIRVGEASRGFSDRVHAVSQLAKGGECDVIMGDCMSENTMTLHGAGKITNKKKNSSVANAPIEQLAKEAIYVVKLCEDAGCPMKVAWVEGDDVTDTIHRLVSEGLKTAAFKEDADIVICGRVADAAPAIGAAAWWHKWTPEMFDKLPGALVIGHLIECSSSVCGGYYSAFKDLLKTGKHLNVGFPIAHIDSKGECILTKEKSTDGCITVGSVTPQFVA